MKTKRFWKILFCLGLYPFLFPVLSGLYHMSIETWTLPDWLILYSFIYWPTYILGAILLVLSVYKLTRP